MIQKKNPVKKRKVAVDQPSTKRPPGHPKEWTEEKLHALGKQLVEVCKEPDVFHIVDFCRSVDKSSAWFYELLRKNPTLGIYHDQAKDILGNKILKLAMKAGNPWVIKTMLPKYLRDVDEYLDDKKRQEIHWQAEAKRAAEADVDSKADRLIAAIEQAVNGSPKSEAN